MRGFVKYLLLLWVGIMAASCVFDVEPCGIPEGEPRSIMFTISLEGQKTRATWEDGYESETSVPFDCRIIPDGLQVIVLSQDGTRLGPIQNLYYWPINDLQTEFRFMGEMPQGFAEYYNAHTDSPLYRFMVLANCSENLSGEEYITYSQSQLDPSLEESSIPMWGVKEVDLTDLQSNSRKDIGDIWLLRAAAKVEVKLSEKLKQKGTAINAATLKYYNQTGYCVPSGGMTVSDTRKLDRDNSVRIYRHTAVNMPFIKDEKTGDYYVYVTEYDNKNYSGERNKISLEFDIKGVTKTFEDAISFCQYSGGAPQEGSDYDIVRNHIYEFEILSIAGDNLTLNYEVADWDAERWDTDNDGVPDSDYEEHELAYPTYHNPVVPADYLTLTTTEQFQKYSIDKEPRMFYNAIDPEAGAFECFFQIVAPTGVQWKPGVSGNLGSYTVRVYSNASNTSKGILVYDTENLQGDLGVCAANTWYRIVVFPRNATGAGQEAVDFMITYYQSWTDQYIHLYINGEYDHIRWPNSGANPKLINIKHVVQEKNTVSE